MGSTLEAAIVFVTVFFIICLMIVLPFGLLSDSFDNTKECVEELDKDDEYGITTEGFNTLLTGLSEDYRMIYGGIYEAVFKEE